MSDGGDDQEQTERWFDTRAMVTTRMAMGGSGGEKHLPPI